MATQAVKVPDVGNYKNIPVIELLVKVGETVTKDQALVTLESDKATMEVPAPFAGVVTELKVKLGDEVSEGTVVAMIEVADAAAAAAPPAAKAAAPTAPTPAPAVAAPAAKSATPAPAAPVAAAVAAAPAAPATTEVVNHEIDGEISGPRTPPVSFDASSVMPDKVAYASPAVRLFARELGVDLDKVTGSGRKERITREDVQAFVKHALAQPKASSAAAPSGGGVGLNLLPWPQVDFSKFGETETKPRSRINKISGANLARNWVMIPHVTQFDDADITDLEALRISLNKENEKSGVKVTMLAFLIKACVAALKKYPDFNSSLDASGDNLVLKKYFNIGFAADTPNGLVVPVLKDADKKGVVEIAQESSALAAKARDGKLGPADMQGGCISISSLGGIGGTAFTPIVNAPEVAILGVSKSVIKPVWNGKEFSPRLILPLSLSYDHRVIDGASAARFTAYLGQLLADMRRVLL
ncbi:dihydrolipoyllysine-residue acetyltransferase [Pseudolysobacter antarcticus]|uniref:Dihydrolipoamide acetyltransferase component of pyruvate dehydrogenase complex n=1 Tax=Pseudolysobacter antarcticus TaxID=2511995 RepID=A0A411HNM9_9GAMM|nr:dihydrolipoyllysine-residue acetyltransferase [Pseudolysobacter antarcticus]QBB72066.1 dihydrolipoyllysine-residue acetyltransferase [Pseudolysobacter antarcticus]